MSFGARVADLVLGPRIPPAERPCALPDGVEVRRNGWIPRIGGWFMGSRRPAGGVTLGRTIVVPEGAEPTESLLVHELVHVEQWRDPLFPLKYCAQWVRRGYRGNPYEIEAYRRQREHAARIPNDRTPRPP